MKRLAVFAALFALAHPIFADLARIESVSAGTEFKMLAGDVVGRFEPTDGPKQFEIGQWVIAEARCKPGSSPWSNCEFESSYEFLIDGHYVKLTRLEVRLGGKGRVHHGPADPDGDGSIILDVKLASGKHCADFYLIPPRNGSGAYVPSPIAGIRRGDEITISTLEKKPYRAVVSGVEMIITSLQFYRCE